MTVKRREIINCSLELFAKQGVKDTSTKQIANRARVSEGLIFRHFNNKKGLVKAVMDNAFDRISPYIEEILTMDNPIRVLDSIVELPFRLLKDEPTYWRLQMSVKFQQNLNDLIDECDHHSPPLMDKVIWAFTKLGFKNPVMEAELFHMVIEGVIHRAILNGTDNQLQNFIKFLKSKYDISETSAP